MQVSDPNNVKIYNLTAGKSLPQWLSDRKKRALLKKDIDLRRRIELLQDFDMPDVSNCIKVSKDGHYILATGIYKPRVRCYEVENLSMKFERCMDSEVVAFEILSDDYSKLVFLQNDRYVEFHAAGGIYHKLRIPKYGRDLKYHYPSCDLYLVGAGSDMYRFNLERGQFMNSLVTEASEIHKIVVNPVHELICVGTKEGKVEAWDPRSRMRVGNLDVAMSCISDDTQVDGFPSVTGLQFNGALTLGVGTATGQILLYDIRSSKPFLVKDHMYGLPIKDIEFHEDYVLSMDSAILKIWEKNNGKLFTSIESGQYTFNNLCHVPNSGLMFMANESPKMYCYYIPTLGPAPKWCSFLDNLTEELEESRVEEVYDDYKFVTRKELDELNLSHLIGTQMLKAYMHGYFMSIRLYNKAKSLSQPFNYEEYKKKKIKEKIESERESRVNLKSLPKVNKDLALKLMDEDRKPKKKGPPVSSLLKDDRFKDLFENPDFEIDKKTEEFRLLNPVISRLDKGRKKELEKQILSQQFQPVEEELEGKPSSEESSSSEDEMEWIKEVKAEHKKLKKEKEAEERRQLLESGPKMYEMKPGTVFKAGTFTVQEDPLSKLTLGERLDKETTQAVKELKSGNKEMTFTINRNKKGAPDLKTIKKHREERRHSARPPPTTFRMPKRKPFKRKRLH